jgi:DNA helicase-2/ATP-dependent DNA helicase PcrA
MDYTSEQQKAIRSIKQNLQIIACAGSGKTQVISARIVEILKTQKKAGITPGNILAFTYTDKAAAELKSRVLKLCTEEFSHLEGLAGMYIGTIHGWCLHFLQDNIFEYQKYSVLDEVTSKLFVDRHYSDCGMKTLGLKQYSDTGYFIQAMSILRESELAPGKKIPPGLCQAMEQYEECLLNAGWLDFTLLMSRAIKELATVNRVRKLISDKIKYLIVDEYQDVNPLQEKIISEIVGLGANICVVGDDDQTIYQWRGSDINYILNFKNRYKEVKEVKLLDNFRSSSAVVDLAVKVIGNNQKRLPKSMKPAGFQKYERGDLLYEICGSVEDENELIAKRIKQLRGIGFKDEEKGSERGLDYSDCCILLRKWKKAEKIVEALKKHDIPFVVAGVNNLFKQSEIKAAVHIYSFLQEQIDEQTLKDEWYSLSSNLDKKLISSAVEKLSKKKPTLKMYYESFILQDIFWAFLEDAGIREEAFHDDSGKTSGFEPEEIIFYNLGMFSQVIDDFEHIHFKDAPAGKLRNFMNFLKYAAEDYYPEGWLGNAHRTPNAVQIMTIYQAKGLEFPVVFVPALNKNYLPAQGIGGRSVWHIVDKELVKDQARYQGGMEDERRLLYVALTRSKKFLLLSRSPVGRNEQKESPFVDEMRKSEYLFSSSERDFSERNRKKPAQKKGTDSIELNFSILKTFLECPWSFKFVTLYGFCQPMSSRVGYGKSIHNMLMEIHRRYLEGDEMPDVEIDGLVDRHLHLPNATGETIKDMKKRSAKNVEEYLREKRPDLKNITFAEKEILISLNDGILVNGRMDLIKRKTLEGKIETTIVDFKSKEDVQKQAVSMDQLSLYALGYKELTGETADFLEIYNLDENVGQKNEFHNSNLNEIKKKIEHAAKAIQSNDLGHKCGKSDCVCRFKDK